MINLNIIFKTTAITQTKFKYNTNKYKMNKKIYKQDMVNIMNKCRQIVIQ